MSKFLSYLFVLAAMLAEVDGFLIPSSPRASLLSATRPANHNLRDSMIRQRGPGQTSRRRHQNLKAMLDVGNLFKGADPPPENILRAVESAGRRVTAADISTSAGVSLSEAQKSLSTLAMLTGGALEVSKDGEIVYAYDSSFRNTLRARYHLHFNWLRSHVLRQWRRR